MNATIVLSRPMTDTSEPAEISLCASILAKAFSENNGSAFVGLHDALKAYLKHNHQSDDEALAGAISKVEELAQKYTRLPVFVLERKIKWLESHGVRPIQYPHQGHATSTVSKHEEKTNHGDVIDEKKEKNVIDSEMDANVVDKNLHSAFPIFNIDSQHELQSVSVVNIADNGSHESERTHSVDVGATSQNSSSKPKYEFIEMQEMSQSCSKNLLNTGETELNSQYETPSLSKKKKNKKKKKKSKSKVGTTTLEVEAKKLKSPEKVEVSGKSSRNVRRRRFLRSRKELKNEVSNDDDMGKREELDEVISMKENDTKSKKKLVSNKKAQMSANMLGSEQGNALRDDLMMQNAAHRDQTTDYTSVLESNPSVTNKNRNMNSVTDVSEKGEKTNLSFSNTTVSNDCEAGFSKPQEKHDKSKSSTIASTSSHTPVFTSVPYSTKVGHSLDSVGGSIASSSEDNSSTSSSGAMDFSNTELGLLPSKVFFLTATRNSAENETETCRVSRNVMHFGNRWDTPFGNRSPSSDTKCDSLKETEVKTLLYNDLGLEFFDVQHTESKQKTSFGNCGDPGSINFMCEFEKPPPISPKNVDHGNGKKESSNMTEAIPSQCCDNTTNFKNCDNLSSSNRSMSVLHTPHHTQKFDYTGAVQFIWTEWKQISS